MRIKICGITKPDQGYAIAQLGATALGFICVPASPRYVTPAQIRAIADQLVSEKVDRIGVFVNSPGEEICQIAAGGNLTGIQLHGDESPEFCRQLRQLLPSVEIIKALRVRSTDDLTEAGECAGWVDTLLLDAYHPQIYGGTGKTLDWKTLQQFHPSCPWLLAGGLTPDNVLDALNQVNPAGIDLSSGVERSPGDKDLTKIAKLFERLAPKKMPAGGE